MVWSYISKLKTNTVIRMALKTSNFIQVYGNQFAVHCNMTAA